MEAKSFNPHVRFFNRRSAVATYPNTVFAYDFRLFYVQRGSFEVELQGERIQLITGSFLTLPPGVGYRLIAGSADVEYFIINFDFDSLLCDTPARVPSIEEAFLSEEIFSQSCIPPFEGVLHISGAHVLEPVLREMEAAEELGTHAATDARSGLMKYLLVRAAHLDEVGRAHSRDLRIQAIRSYVEQNFSKAINNQTVALEMGYHPNYLNTFFLDAEGITLHSYIESVRIKHAKELLVTTQLPICEIAQACGVAEASYFVKFFFRHTGTTPGRYRKLSM